MRESKETHTGTTRGGLDFASALAILLIGLKLCGVIDWSWWWILSPIWIPLGLALLILSVLFIPRFWSF